MANMIELKLLLLQFVGSVNLSVGALSEVDV